MEGEGARVSRKSLARARRFPDGIPNRLVNGRDAGLRVVIYPNDRHPAHVHVKGAGGEVVS